ncbi:AAA ATPase domain-containing protein [Tieghemostelium lacteum]|uniref:Peroxisomal ATPase PEX6 n=1 Tax=Tieghemostelium lacteum TaxID=361077 RepID=A0A152AA89_TIELA|nr:AAA ATPase domain-containing protein [Tieghemostelium lacteum]|eukprot:KYR03143.1 AAA ATPase domain-containing protein [Tieghemostelium lacteum]
MHKCLLTKQYFKVLVIDNNVFSSKEFGCSLDNIIINFTCISNSSIDTFDDYFLFIRKLNRLFTHSTQTLPNTSTVENLVNFTINFSIDVDDLVSSFDSNGVVTPRDDIVIISSQLANYLSLSNQDQIHLQPILKNHTILERVVLLSSDIESFNESIDQQDQSSNSNANRITKYLAKESFRRDLIDKSLVFIQSSPSNTNSNIIELDDGKFKYKTLECYPLIQGSVGVSTTIIVLAPDDQIIIDRLLKPNSDDILKQEKEEKYSKSLEPLNSTLKLSSFIIHPTNISNNRNNLFHYSPGLFQSNYIIIKCLESVFSNNSHINTLFEQELQHTEYNNQIDALVNIKTLKNLNLFNSSLIKLSNLHNKSTIICRIYSVSNSNNNILEDDIVYLPPLSLFNLKYQISQSIATSATTPPQKIQLIVINNNNFTVANRIKISRVLSQHSSGYQSYAEQLKFYFSEKRIMKEGDIFTVPHSSIVQSKKEVDDGEECHETLQIPNKIHSSKLIYFKVESIHSSNSSLNDHDSLYQIDTGVTSIIQEGSSHSYLPVNMNSYYSLSTDNVQNTLYKSVYKKEYQLILDLIEPFMGPLKFNLDFICTLLIHGPKSTGKATLLRQVADELGLQCHEVDCYDIYNFQEQKKDELLKQTLLDSSLNTPVLLILKNFEVLEKSPTMSMQQEKKESNVYLVLKESLSVIMERQSSSPLPFIVSATVESLEEMSGKVRSWFKHEIKLDAPDEGQRLQVLKQLTSRPIKLPLDQSISLKNIAIRTASFLPGNLQSLIQKTCFNAIKRVLSGKYLKSSGVTALEICNCGFTLNEQDISSALGEIQEYQSSSIGAPKIPNVKWDDVGGLANVKSEIMDTIQLPLEHPHLFASGIGKRSGILLYGPPGTGKTLLAKAIATECSLNFLSVKGPELINMYIGESEKNIREIFNKARQAKPCVIFFDELDSLAPSRGNGADSGGVMDRVVSQLLAELDGMQKSSDVFIIGATNRPDLLDKSLMRPGRLDRLLYLGISQDKENQLKIVQALVRKFNLGETVDLRAIVESCPMNLTGADFYALCSDALANAMKERILKLQELIKTNQITPDDEEENQGDQKLIVEQCHFVEAVNKLVPSVSLDELEYYHKVQKQFSSNNNNNNIQ